MPLLTTSSGQKFGKSAGNAVWLSPDRTSPYDLYQYFYNTSDADVRKLLCMLTFIPMPEIDEIMSLQQVSVWARARVCVFLHVW